MIFWLSTPKLPQRTPAWWLDEALSLSAEEVAEVKCENPELSKAQ